MQDELLTSLGFGGRGCLHAHITKHTQRDSPGQPVILVLEGQRQEFHSKFKTILSFLLNSRPARATHKDLSQSATKV